MNKSNTSRQKDESAADYLQRVACNLNYEQCALLDDLPSVEAVLAFFDLWHVYDTDFWAGVLEGISDGDDPTPARDFIAKYKLKGWLADVRMAERIWRESKPRARAS